MNNSKEKIKIIIIKDILVPSLRKLYEYDYFNICNSVSERNICARLAHYMENIMRRFKYKDDFKDYYADVEYNRIGWDNVKNYENIGHYQQPMVSDLLIHQRGSNPNYLAVEMKRAENSKHVTEDKERLNSMVSSPTIFSPKNCVHDTILGAFITYSSNFVIIELFENKNGKGLKFNEIKYICQYHNNRVILRRVSNNSF